ncbi:hypothetical protein [Aliarcobacter butzleri]|uniref:hypothetical protein n=1 Tax=Aliarcobacter butzleri TaxID=28197 RepID=UPI0012FB9A88|nr:hypothetical protein [Aliarcobacter butzleri]
MKNEIIKAYLNEIEIDKKAISMVSTDYKEYYNNYLFKVLKVTKMNDKKFKIFNLLVKIYTKIWFVLFILITFQYLKTFFIKKEKFNLKKKNIGIIVGLKSKSDIEKTGLKDILYIDIRVNDIYRYLTHKDLYLIFLYSIKNIYFVKNNKILFEPLIYNSLKLHMNDIMKLEAYKFFLKKHDIQSNNIIIHDHYDRWAYISSVTIKLSKLHIVQHGFIDNSILFNYKQGKVDVLYLYDNKFYPIFMQYFSEIISTKKVSTNIALTDLKTNKKIVFIASSLPYINIELDCIRLLIDIQEIELVVKIHPSYDYKNKFNKYVKQITFVDKNIFPDADITITYNSFLGYEYKLLGKEVYWLEEYESKLDILIDIIKEKLK